MRLSDLLERVRPAGAPGASAEGESHHAQEIAHRDLAEVAAALAGFAAEADEIVVAAQAEVDAIDRTADRRVRQIRAGRADRLARASASVAQPPAGSADDDPARIADESRAASEQARANARREIPRLVDAALAVIWSEVHAQPSAGDSP